MFDKLDVLQKRLSKIGIEIKVASNVPWIYLIKVNNQDVLEKSGSEYGFVIGYLGVKIDSKFEFSDNTSELFKVLRKYGKRD